MKTYTLTSPHMHGGDVKDIQYLLQHNKFGDFKPGAHDGEYGEQTALAARHAKWQLGYPKRKLNGTFGNTLYSYLHGDKKLTPAMRARRKLRLKTIAKANTVKERALVIALGEAKKGVTESPAGSNSNPYGRWYGFNRVPWCAIFVTYCFDHAGDKRIPRTALAYQFEYWARAHQHGLSVTHDPQPGDIVVYHHGQGHTGIFKEWTAKRAGRFRAVEGNTSSGGSQDNGGAVLVQDRHTGWVPTVFVRVA